MQQRQGVHYSAASLLCVGGNARTRPGQRARVPRNALLHKLFTCQGYSSAMSTLRILHLTDTHMFGDDSRHYGVVDTAAHLRLALARMDRERLDLVVCSGDVSEDGSMASYERVRGILEPWAAERGARTVYAMGNHDRRAEFRAVLGDGQPGTGAEVTVAEAAGQGAPAQADAPIVSVAVAHGWRTVVLDTSVPGAGYGELGEEQLAWLGEALAEPAEHGTVVVMHHPPVAARTDLLQALALDDESADGLWARLRGSDVRVILSGHYHHPIVETVAGIPVVVAPGVTNLAEAFAGREDESAADWFGGALVEVSADRVRVLPFTEPATGAEVFRFDATQVRQIIEVAGRA